MYTKGGEFLIIFRWKDGASFSRSRASNKYQLLLLILLLRDLKRPTLVTECVYVWRPLNSTSETVQPQTTLSPHCWIGQARPAVWNGNGRRPGVISVSVMVWNGSSRVESSRCTERHEVNVNSQIFDVSVQVRSRDVVRPLTRPAQSWLGVGL